MKIFLALAVLIGIGFAIVMGGLIDLTPVSNCYDAVMVSGAIQQICH